MWKIERLVKKGDYTYAVVLDHPKRTANNYVLHHRVVMENHLGRLLDSKEIVHHKNGNKKDNSVENLELMCDRQHHSLHSAQNTRRKMVRLKCPQCDSIFDKSVHQYFPKLKTAKYKVSCCSRSCRGKFFRKIQLEGLTAEMEDAISVNIQKIYFMNDLDSLDDTEETFYKGSVETITHPT